MKTIEIHRGLILKFGYEGSLEYLTALKLEKWEQESIVEKWERTTHYGQAKLPSIYGLSSNKNYCKSRTHKKERRRANMNPECLPCYKAYTHYLF